MNFSDYEFYKVSWHDNKPTVKLVKSFADALHTAGKVCNTKKELYQYWHQTLALEIQQAQECLANLEAAVEQFNDEEE